MDKVSTTDTDSAASGDDSFLKDDEIVTTEGHPDKTADTSDDDDTSSTDDTDDNAPSDAVDDSTSDDKKSEEDKKTEEDAPAFDKDLDDWALKAGHGKLETDKERKLAQVARDSQRAFSRGKAAESKTADAIKTTSKTENQDDDTRTDDQKRLDNIEANQESETYQRRNTEYFLAMSEAGTPVTEEEGEMMAKILTEAKEQGDDAMVKSLLNNSKRWHQLAKVEISENSGDSDSSKTDEDIEKARLEERKRLEKRGQASSPSQSAKTNTPAKQKDEVKAIWDDDSI